jgi:hypothetical protein
VIVGAVEGNTKPPSELFGIPVITSEFIDYGRVIVSSDPQRVIISALRRWVWKMRKATLPASTDGAEFVSHILGVSL